MAINSTYKDDLKNILAMKIGAPEREPAVEEDLPPVDTQTSAYKSMSTGYSGPTAQEKELFKNIQGQGELIAGQAEEQQAMYDAAKAAPQLRDISPTLEYGYRVAGRTPAEMAASVAAARPQSAEEKRAELQKALGAAIGGRDKSIDNQTALLKILEGNRRGANDSSKDNRFMMAQDKSIFQDVKKEFTKPTEDLNQFYQSYDVIKSAVDTGDVYAVQNALSNFARLSGEKGVLTDEDIKRVVPSNLQASVAKTMARLRSDPEYPIPPAVATAMTAAIDRLRDAAEKRYENTINTRKKELDVGPGSYPKYSQLVHGEALKAKRKREPAVAKNNKSNIDFGE